MIKKCFYCKKEFKTFDKRRKYCSEKCYRKYQKQNPYKVCFKKGSTPWNKNTKGIMKANSGSFKKGQKPITWRTVKSITQRKDKGGKIRRWIKIKEPNKWELCAVYLWKIYYGFIIKGDVIHHINGDTLDDRIQNIIALPRKDHPIFHNRWGLMKLTEKQLDFYKNRYKIKERSE